MIAHVCMEQEERKEPGDVAPCHDVVHFIADQLRPVLVVPMRIDVSLETLEGRREGGRVRSNQSL